MRALVRKNAQKEIFARKHQLHLNHVQLGRILKTQEHRSVSIAFLDGMPQQQVVKYVHHAKQGSLQIEQNNHLVQFATQVSRRDRDQPYVHFVQLVNLVIIPASVFHAPQTHTVIQKAKRLHVQAAHLGKKATKILFHVM